MNGPGGLGTAIALAVQGGEAAARALADLVEGHRADGALRRTALEALGLTAARLPIEASAQRHAWTA
jgi:hypothetical protein